MIKIFLTVRNRLSMTKKCIQAIQNHSTLPYQLYVYNNQTNYKLDEHYRYFYNLQNNGQVTQVVFNTDASVYNAFSKASACNMFGLWHQQDPNRKNFIFLLMLDNDIILTPSWDKNLLAGWKYVKNKKMNNIKVIGQLPGGIKNRTETHDISGEIKARAGKLGGSGLWSVRTNFFDDVGFLSLPLLVGQNKRHDQLYWRLLDKSSGGHPYILGLNKKIGIHCGSMAGSVCNKLTRNYKMKEDQKLDAIKFEHAEEKIDSYTFSEFFKLIYNDKSLLSDW